MPELLKALSIRQPWAELVLRGEKLIEYRSKPTKMRGRIYIYASLSQLDPAVERGIEEEIGFSIADLPRGLVVGTVDIVDCTGSDVRCRHRASARLICKSDASEVAGTRECASTTRPRPVRHADDGRYTSEAINHDAS